MVRKPKLCCFISVPCNRQRSPTQKKHKKEVENSMKEIKKILDVMAMLEERRVSLASFMLWDMIKTTQDVTKIVWMQFEELLLSNYFPEAVRRQKRAEFIHLVQRNMTVTEYATKFTQLSRYAPNVVADEQMRAE